MQEDLAALKKGQQPTGAKLEKQSEKDLEQSTEATVPKITPPPRISPKVELGRLEKTKSFMDRGVGAVIPSQKPEKEPKKSKFSFFGLGKAKPSKEQPITPPGMALKIPPKEGPLRRFSNVAIDVGGKRRILFIAIGAIAAMTLLIFWVFGNFFDREEAVFSPTPRPTLTQTVSPVITPFENYFSITETLNMDLAPGFLNAFQLLIDKDELSSVNEPGLYTILDSTGITRHGMRNIMDILPVQVPTSIQNAVSDKDFYMTSFVQENNALSYGFIVKIDNDVSIKTAVSLWESSMSDTLNVLFEFNPNDSASSVFLDNTYDGVAIRYRNFPLPNLTIDYAIIKSANGNSYLVFTNSRSHIYRIIDLIK